MYTYIDAHATYLLVIAKLTLHFILNTYNISVSN